MTEPIIGRITKQGKTFEVLLDPEKTYQYLDTKKGEISDLLTIDKVFRDSRKGLEASRNELIKAFGKENILKILEEILNEGSIQITAERRRKLIERKTNQIVTYIYENYVDPKTKAPHPRDRILKAMKKAKVKVDPFKDTIKQALSIVEQINAIIPLKTGKFRFEVEIPIEKWGKATNILKTYGKVITEKQMGDKVKIRGEAAIPVQPKIIEKIVKIGGKVNPINE